MMVRWAVMADPETAKMLDEMKQIPIAQRKKDRRIIETVRGLKEKWLKGTRIERIASLGWIEDESIGFFCQMLDQLDALRKEYADEVAKKGVPPELKNTDYDQYTKTSNEARRSIGF